MVSRTQLEAKRGKSPKLLMWQSRWQCVAAVQLLLQLSDMLISRLHDSSRLLVHVFCGGTEAAVPQCPSLYWV